MEETRAFRKDIEMTDRQVIESFDNAWRALCRQYRAYPSAEVQSAINMLGRMIGQVKREVEESHRDHQITVDEWIRMLEGEQL